MTKAEHIQNKVEELNNGLSNIKSIDEAFFTNLIAECVKYKLPISLANCYINWAHLVLLIEDDIKSATKIINKVTKKIREKLDEDTLSKYHTVVGSIHQVNNDFNKAIENYNLSILALRSKKKKDRKSWRRIMVNYYNMSVLFLNMKDMNKSKFYLQKAEKLAEKIEDKNYIANCCYQWNGIYYFSKKYDLASQFINRAIAIFKELGNEYRLGLSYNNLAAILLEQKKYKSALPSFLEAYYILRKASPMHNFTIETNNIGRCYLYLNDMENAKKWLTKSFQLSKQSKNINYKLVGHNSLSEYYEKIGQHKKALSLKKETDQFKEEMYNADRNKIVLDIEEKYQNNFKQIEINNRIKKQREINKYLKQVELKNDELKQFSLALAHDLKEPIRSTKSFLDIIQARNNSLDESSKKYFKIAYGNLDRMNQLILDILNLTKIDFEENKKTIVDLNEVIELIKQNLGAQFKEKTVELIVGNLPKIKYDKQHILQIFQNLISNGIKYNKNNPKITVTAAPYQSKTLITIQDNGIGIPEKAMKEVFGLFKRAHAKEYDGTGVGLSICKKIVEKNKGQIWVKSVEGEGTTFYFTV